MLQEKNTKDLYISKIEYSFIRYSHRLQFHNIIHVLRNFILIRFEDSK